VADRVEYAEVRLWDRMIGAVIWDDDRRLATFEYEPGFSGLEVAPLTMPVGPGRFQFPDLAYESYFGLPGMLADSFPDKFGNALIDAWVARQGRVPASFSPIERLCYIGARGMGALEYQPATRRPDESARLQVDQLVTLASEIVAQRRGLDVALDDDGLAELLRVGTSAGGARAKAIIALNRRTGEIRSGQVAAPAGFEYWILKFDGVDTFDDRELSSPAGYGRLEYAYYLMAGDAGLMMMPSELHTDEAGRAHFMTKRFDRSEDGDKIHMQTLSGLAHLDFNMAGAHSYEQALAITLRLCGAADTEQLFRRLVFNVVARNQDDHTKNIAFLMDRDGVWSLAPAYDVTWAYNPRGDWTSRHQMTINGKRDEFARSDLEAAARQFGVRHRAALIDEVVAAVARWPRFAAEVGVGGDLVERAGASHRLDLA
jgi:serine/threonine-protein kinase HipA